MSTPLLPEGVAGIDADEMSFFSGGGVILTHTDTRNGKKILGDGSYPSVKVPDILQ